MATHEIAKTRNGADDSAFRRPPDTALKRLVHQTIGCCLQVHRELGPGLTKAIYVRALCIELATAGSHSNIKNEYRFFYRGRLLCEQRVDVLVDSRLVLEIKSVERSMRFIMLRNSATYASLVCASVCS